ncbi:hypothetical protein GCM10012276_19800 [Nocardioides deserti]|nr:hypothetical protein GCM10012276_19800 [Nocardioides deserti]
MCALRLVLRLVSVVGALVVIGTVTPTPHAAAHPFGDPSVAQVDLEAPDTVRVTWRFGMSDDLTYLAQWLDLLPPERFMLDGAVFFEPADQDLLATSTAFADYLLEQVSVTTADGACTGTVVDIAHLVDAGVTLDFACPGTVSEAQVELAMLTDMNPAYKTMASGPEGQKQVYDGGQETHVWALAAAGGAGTSTAPDLGRSAAVQTGSVLGAVALVSVLGGLVWHRRREKQGMR